VHRDLKPDNVMWDPATRRVKLLDFGIAADQGQNADERLTRAGFFVGTLMYVAPEALSGAMVTAGGRPVLARDHRVLPALGLPPVHGQVAARDVHPAPLAAAAAARQGQGGAALLAAVEQVVMRGLAKAPATAIRT
jgi:serine/threonine-protein kinase